MLRCHYANHSALAAVSRYAAAQSIGFGSQKHQKDYKRTMDWLAEIKEAAASATYDQNSLIWDVDAHGMKVRGILQMAGEAWDFVLEKAPRPPARYPCLWVSSKSRPAKHFSLVVGTYQAYRGEGGMPFHFQDTPDLSLSEIEMRNRIDIIIERLRPRLPQFPS